MFLFCSCRNVAHRLELAQIGFPRQTLVGAIEPVAQRESPVLVDVTAGQHVLESSIETETLSEPAHFLSARWQIERLGALKLAALNLLIVIDVNVARDAAQRVHACVAARGGRIETERLNGQMLE